MCAGAEDLTQDPEIDRFEYEIRVRKLREMINEPLSNKGKRDRLAARSGI
jgi:hypothetical protein